MFLQRALRRFISRLLLAFLHLVDSNNQHFPPKAGDFMQQNSHHVLNERPLFGSFSTPDDYPHHAPVSFSNSNLPPAAIFKSSNLPFASNGGLRQRTSDYSSSQSKVGLQITSTIFNYFLLISTGFAGTLGRVAPYS